MGKNKRNITLRVRYRDGFNIRSRLVVGGNKRAAKGFNKGKVLRVEKVSKNELYHMGEFNDMPNRLMREFEGNGKKYGNNGGNGKKSIDDLLDTIAQENAKVK